jgi:hypothetical protein
LEQRRKAWTDSGVHDDRGLKHRSCKARGGASGDEVSQQPVQPVEETGAFVGQVIAAFGQQPQDGGLVFGGDDAQVGAVQGDLGDAERVGGVGLAAPAGGQQPGPDRQGRRHVDDVFTGRRQLLGDPSAETACALDREPALRPCLRPLGQLSEGSGVDDEPALRDRVT